jgi:hypothetical protein
MLDGHLSAPELKKAEAAPGSRPGRRPSRSGLPTLSAGSGTAMLPDEFFELRDLFT